MNCLAGCLQMAGTVITHLMSSLTILVEDWSDSSCRQWSLKNLNAWENTINASIFFPFAAWISTPLWRSYIVSVEREGGRESILCTNINNTEQVLLDILSIIAGIPWLVTVKYDSIDYTGNTKIAWYVDSLHYAVETTNTLGHVSVITALMNSISLYSTVKSVMWFWGYS